MREDAPILARKEPHEVALNRFSARGAAEPKAAGKPGNMSVNHDALIDAKAVSEHHIRCLSGDAAQEEKFIHRPGNFAAEPFEEELCCLMDGAGLTTKQANRANVWFDFGWGRAREIRDGGKSSEKSGRRAIDSNIRALGGENCCDE